MSYIGYEYKELTVPGRDVSLLLDGYESFGWQPDENHPAPGQGRTVTLYLKRDRKIDLGRMVQERQRNTTFVPQTEGYTTVEFEMMPCQFSLTREVSPTPFVPLDATRRAERCELILRIQAEGLAKRMEHTHARCAVVGISGGLDSCLALLVAVRACKVLERDPKEIVALTMPCFGTTKRTRSNAEILCEALGVTFDEINITNTVNSHFADIGQDRSCPL